MLQGNWHKVSEIIYFFFTLLHDVKVHKCFLCRKDSITWAYGVVVSMFVCHRGDWGMIPNQDGEIWYC